MHSGAAGRHPRTSAPQPNSITGDQTTKIRTYTHARPTVTDLILTVTPCSTRGGHSLDQTSAIHRRSLIIDTRAHKLSTKRETHVRRVIRWMTDTWAECDYVGRRRLEIMLGRDFTKGKRSVRPSAVGTHPVDGDTD